MRFVHWIQSKRLTPFCSSLQYLLVILVFLICIDGFGLWFASKRDYDQAYRRAELILQKATLSLEERIKRTILSSDAILRGLDLEIEKGGMKQTEEQWERLEQAASRLPDKSALLLIDRDGNLVLNSRAFPPKPVNYSDREYFTAHRDKGIELYIGTVFKGKVSGKYHFSISRRITGKDGRFLGLILAAIQIDGYAEFLQFLDIGRDSSLGIFSMDGSLVLKQPMLENYVGRNFSMLKWYTLVRQKDSGVYLGGGIDPRKRLVSFRKVEGLPLVAEASVPIDSIFENWFHRVKIYSAVSLMFLMVLLGFAWLVRRKTMEEEKEKSESLSRVNVMLQKEIEDREQAEEALKRNESTLRAVLEQMPTGVTIRNARTGELIFRNEKGKALMRSLLVNRGPFPMFQAFHKDGLQYKPEEWPTHRSISTGEIVSGEEIECERIDGGRMTLMISSAPIHDAMGDVSIVVGMFYDITERKKVEAELEKIRFMLSEGQRIAHVGSFEYIVQTKKTVWSEEECRIYGLPPKVHLPIMT